MRCGGERKSGQNLVKWATDYLMEYKFAMESVGLVLVVTRRIVS